MSPREIDPIDWLRKRLEQGTDDVMRSMLQEFAEHLTSAEAYASCGSGLIGFPHAYLADVLIRVQTHPASQAVQLSPDPWAQLRG